MSKETQLAQDCPGCGQRIAFPEYHIPHCPNVKGFDWSKAKAKTKNK